MKTETIVEKIERLERSLEEAHGEIKLLKGGFTIDKWNDKMSSLKTISEWRMGNGDLIGIPNGFANDDMFIKLGKLQKKIKNIAFFQHCYGGFPGLSIQCKEGYGLDDLWNIVKNIDTL